MALVGVERAEWIGEVKVIVMKWDGGEREGRTVWGEAAGMLGDF